MENELKAIQEFLSNYVTPFFGNRLRPNVLKELVASADVLNIEADPDPYAPVKVVPGRTQGDIEQNQIAEVNQIFLIQPEEAEA